MKIGQSPALMSVVAVFSAIFISSPVATAQTSKAYEAPRTQDGQPDLQGYWSNPTYTPLQRPDNVNKPLYTKEEAEAAFRRAAADEAEQTVPGTVADVHYDFTQFGLDRSQSAQWKKTIGPIFEHACHEGNYGLANTLAGARAEEKRAIEKGGKRD